MTISTATPEPSSASNSAGEPPPLTGGQRRLWLFLRVVAVITWLAFLAAVMPEKWIVEISEALGFEPFPDSSLTFYLARHLSLLYGCVGVGLWLVTSDLHRYRPLIRWLAFGTIAFGIGQAIIDLQSSMPLWWTWSESLSSVVGGLLVWWLDKLAD